MDADSALSQLVEAASRVLVHGDEPTAHDRQLVRRILIAMLRADLTEPCPDKVTLAGPGNCQDGRIYWTADDEGTPCPRCEGSGRVPSSVRLLIGEQVGDGKQQKDGSWWLDGGIVDPDDLALGWEPVYRVITKGDAE